ncbi:MAG: hypothetical protein EBR82_75270 [Caulobacteraceae bacterium]|nr:hypothetical protein [Caulobacteraceae bacterium]
MPLGKDIGKNIRELRADNRKKGSARGAGGKPRSAKQILAIALRSAGVPKKSGRSFRMRSS